jgi:hypothetical protein
MDFEAIYIHYWYSDLSDTIGLTHKSYHPYSEEFKMMVINKCLQNGLQVMLQANPEGIVTIFIDNGRFRQR